MTQRTELSFVEAVRLGDELLQSGRFADAEPLFRAACAADPGQQRLVHCLAVALIEQEIPEKCREARELLQRLALYHRDELVSISCNMGKVLGELGRSAEAEAAFEGVLRSYPDHLLARYGRGLMRMQRGCYAEAIADFDAVVAQEPDNGKARFARGFANLVLGNYADGFRDYEHRLKDEIADPGKPEWTGSEPLAGKTILVHGEQGHGDDIMFMRYFPLLLERGAKVLAVLHPGVGPLAQNMAGVTVIGEDRSTWPAFDCWIRMMSLAGAFHTTVDTVPPPAHLNLASKRHGTINAAPGRLKVGLCWSGSPKSRYDVHRSIPLADLAPLFDLPGVQFYSLQLGVRERDAKAFAKLPLVDLAPGLKDFRDTARAMAALDLVLTCDTSVAHLAGTVGVPTFVLLTAFRTYWLWIQDRQTSPWYPSARVFRQRQDGDWPELVDRVCSELSQWRTAPAA